MEIYHKCPAGGSAVLEGRRTVSLLMPNPLVDRWQGGLLGTAGVNPVSEGGPYSKYSCPDLPKVA